MRRWASPELVTVTSFQFASLMNVVGNIADAVTVTTLTPVSSIIAVVKNPASLVGVTHVVPKYPVGKFAEKIFAASSSGVAGVEVARGGQRRAVHRLGQLSFDDIGAAAVDRQAGDEAKGRQGSGHVHQGKAVLFRKDHVSV